eukprot:1414288-Prymnesium_polylepis.1
MAASASLLIIQSGFSSTWHACICTDSLRTHGPCCLNVPEWKQRNTAARLVPFVLALVLPLLL